MIIKDVIERFKMINILPDHLDSHV